MSGLESDAEYGGMPPQRRRRLQEIVRDKVLPYLPATALLRFRAVCPSWHQLISTPVFQHRQSNTHQSLSGFILCDPKGVEKDLYLPFNPTAAHNLPHPNCPLHFLLAGESSGTVHALASTYGLVLAVTSSDLTNRLTLKHPAAYTVCNPATAQWAAIPKRGKWSHDGVALVFDPSNFFGDYLVVSTFSVRDKNQVPPRHDRKFVVFCSKAEKWRSVSKTTLPGTETALSSPRGLAAGGKAYWRTAKGKILSYDPEADEAEVLYPPREASVDRAVVWQIGELASQLCCVTYDFLQGALDVSVLVFDDNAGISSRWEKLQTIDVGPPSDDARPLMFHGGDGEVLALIEGVVMAYKAATGVGRIICEVPLPEFELLPYISSLVIIKEIHRGIRVSRLPRATANQTQ